MENFAKFSRKELQALCKKNGIPANKTNAFMMYALAKKRVPLSQMDSNRDQKVDSSIRSPLKSPPVARKSVSNVNSLVGPTQKPPVFTNNFLRRGRRKDPPTSNDIEPEKQKVPRTTATSGFRKSSTDVIPGPGAAQGKEEVISSNATKEGKVITSRVTSSNSLTNPSKEKLEDRVRSRIDAALCTVQLSKVMKVPERRPSVATSSGPSELVVDSNVKLGSPSKEKLEDRVRSQIDAALCTVQLSKVTNFPERRPSVATSSGPSELVVDSSVKLESSGALTLPLEQQKEVGHVKVENSELFDVHSECSEQQMLSFPLPDAPANQSTTQENVSTSTPALPRSTSLQLIAASPPVSFSPLVRQMEDKVRSIVDRVQNFWKGMELAVVNNFGSPVQ